MKLLFSISLFVLAASVHGQVTGLWRSTDHINNEEKSIVRLYEQGGKLYGLVEKLLPAATVTHCTGCDGDQKGKPITGMIIIKDLEKDGSKWVNGKILDPTNGKYYSCNIEPVSHQQIKVTGYLGLPMFGKDMIWNREK